MNTYLLLKCTGNMIILIYNKTKKINIVKMEL